MCVVTMENALGEVQPSVNNKKFILGQDSTNVAYPLNKNLSPFVPEEVTLEKIVTCAMCVQSFSC